MNETIHTPGPRKPMALTLSPADTYESFCTFRRWCDDALAHLINQGRKDGPATDDSQAPMIRAWFEAVSIDPAREKLAKRILVAGGIAGTDGDLAVAQ